MPSQPIVFVKKGWIRFVNCLRVLNGDFSLGRQRGHRRRHDDAVVVGSVHRPAREALYPVNEQAVLCFFALPSQRLNESGGGFEPVAFLDAKALGIIDAAVPVGQSGGHR